MCYPFHVDLRKHGNRLVDIDYLAACHDSLTEADLAELLGVSEAHARRHRTGSKPLNVGAGWPQHYRDPDTGVVFYKRSVVKRWLAKLPAVEVMAP